MHYSTTFFLASLVSNCLALPHSLSSRQSPAWSITNFNPGCGTSPAGCAYSFDIASSDPAFSTSCTGTDIQGNGFRPCALTNVTSNEIPHSGGYDVLYVRYAYSDMYGLEYIDEANVTITEFETSGQSFTVVPVTVI